MAQIIKQPNGLYCLYSSIVDSITQYNLTKEEIVESFLEEAREKIIRKVDVTISKLERGVEPYFQFTKTFEEALKETKKRYPTEAKKIKKAVK